MTSRHSIRDEAQGESLSFRFLGETHRGIFVGYTEGDRAWLDIKPSADSPVTYSVRRGDAYRGAVPVRKR